ncbi:hypothetical protein MMC26_006184 [Xylographa opegraphella]|nr:hypothetical protein [Xylographa opegraphella]
MAADALASSGRKRTSDNFGDARRFLHKFGGDDWSAKFKAYGVPLSPRVFFDREDETVGKNMLDVKRRRRCNRLWGLAMSHFVHSKVGWEIQDSMLTFRKPIAIGSTSLITVAAGKTPTVWRIVKETLPSLWVALGEDRTPREVLIHRRLSELSADNENIIKLYEYRRFPDQKKHRLYMEYASHGDLETLIRRYARWRRYFPEPFLWYIFHHLAKAVLILQQGYIDASDDHEPPGAGLPVTQLSNVSVPTSQPSQPTPIQIQTLTPLQASVELQRSGTWDITEVRRRYEYQRIIISGNTTAGGSTTSGGTNTAVGGASIAAGATGAAAGGSGAAVGGNGTGGSGAGGSGAGGSGAGGSGAGGSGAGGSGAGGSGAGGSGAGGSGAGGSGAGGSGAAAAGGPSTTGGGSNTTNGAASLPQKPKTVEDELLWAHNAITALKRRMDVSKWHEIVHRDICPSNVVLCDPDPDSPWDFYPIPKLADFGDAIETGPDDHSNPENYQYETQDGIDWAPPEAAGMSGMRFSGKTNVYQLGLLMAYATYLDPDSVQNARLGKLSSDCPYRISLVRAIESCLHRDPEERIAPLALYKLTRTCLADCTEYRTERAPNSFRVYEPTEARTQEMATGFYRPCPQPLALVDVQFPLADVDPDSQGVYLVPPSIGRFYPYEDDNLDFFENGDNEFAQRQQPDDEVLPQDVISIADRGKHYYNKLADPDFDAHTFNDLDKCLKKEAKMEMWKQGER